MSRTELKGVLPVQYAAIDSLYYSCVKFYVIDILNIPEVDVPNASGVHKYKSHLIRNVDIMGVVVKVDVRQKIIIYSVDDGTGVINCACWKTPFHDRNLQSVDCLVAATTNVNLLKKLNEIKNVQQSVAEGFTLGTLLHVRGHITTFNGVREIKAFHFAAVQDPNAETDRMLERRRLYQQCYDTPITLATELAIKLGLVDGSAEEINTHREADVQRDLTEAVLRYLKDSRKQIVDVKSLSTDAELKALAAKSADPTILEKVFANLEHKGYLCQHQVNKQQYRVIANDADLRSAVVKVIKMSSQHDKGENGCHFLHVYYQLRKMAPYSQLQKAALQRCLELLQQHSDIVATSNLHYIAIG